MPRFLHRLPFIFATAWVIVSAASCGNIKNLQYLQGNLDTAALKSVNIPEPIIQKGDLLSIVVYSDDPRATASVMRPNSDGGTLNFNAGMSTSAAATPTAGYLVNQQGEIQLFKLGRIKAEGKTKAILADTLASLYTEQGLLKNPFVEVRFLNYKITVIGEVGRPGVYNIPADKVSAFEAIGLAGDITQYGRRDNILVIRETGGTRTFGRINLSSPDAFSSPYFYLQQNDMVIVDVGKNKSAVNNQNTTQTVTIVTSVLTTIAIFISIFR
jgi:polysaccharide export outer membrane protein